MRSDRVFGLMGLVFSAFYLWQATLIAESFMADVVGARTFPYILGVLLGVCSLIMMLRPDAEPEWPRGRNLLEVLMAIAVLLAYSQILPVLGFLITTALAAAYLTWRLGTLPLWSLVTGVATSAGIYVVFKLILGLSLAEGILGF